MASTATPDPGTSRPGTSRAASPRRAEGELLRAVLDDRARRGDVYAPECPSRALLDHVTSRWGVLVMVRLLEGPRRFGELGAGILGVSDKMLSQTLKQLCADGFVRRTVSDDPPVRVSYALTPFGEEVGKRLAELVEWIELNVGEVIADGAA